MTSPVSDAMIIAARGAWDESITWLSLNDRLSHIYLAMEKAKEEAADPIDYCPLSFGMAQDGQSPADEVERIIRDLRFFSCSALAELTGPQLEEWAGASWKAIDALSAIKGQQSTVDEAGSLTLDNASVQRLLDYGVLHFENGRWIVAIRNGDER